MRSIGLALFLVLPSMALYSDTPTDTLGLLPRPQSLKMTDGTFSFEPAKTVFTITATSMESAQRLERHLRETLDNLHLQRKPIKIETMVGDTFSLVARTGSAKGDIHLPPPTPINHPEGYDLTIDPKYIRIHADTEPGLFYGLTTLEQIFTSSVVRKDRKIPCLHIADRPAIQMRGYSEDYGRNQLPTMEDHKRSIRILSRFKVNTYLFFIEPDHFVYKFDSEIGLEYDRFQFEELKEIVAYAKQYYMTVIPTVELLAHMENLLAHPKYGHLAEVKGGSELCPTSDEAFSLVERIVGEVSDAFDSPYFHCGLDESYSVGKGQSKEVVERLGREKVIADYYIRMNDLVRSHGKKMMMYADIALKYPGILELLPKDISMMFWDYEPRDRYTGIDTLLKAGFEVTTLSGLWDWNNLYPIYARSFRNMEALALQTAQTGAVGHFVSSWGDPYRNAAGTNLHEWNHYGVAYCASVSWNPSPIPFEEYSRDFALHYFHSDSPKLAEALTRMAQSQGDRSHRARFLFHTDTVTNVRNMAKADEHEMAYWNTLKEYSGQAHDILKDIRVRSNRDYLRSVDLAARMLQWSADMAFACRALAQSVDKPDFNAEFYAKALEKLAKRQEKLWPKYRDTYATTNRPINLKHIQKVWDWTHEQIMVAAQDLRSGTFPDKLKAESK